MQERLTGKWALVTGASGGLGAAFATALAERGANLVLAARRKDEMERLAHDLKQMHQVEVTVEGADLSVPGSGRTLHESLRARGIAIDLLVNNAGLGMYGDFAGQPIDAVLAMLQLNVASLVELTHLFAGDMVARGRGHVMLVASLTAYQPIPTYAAYAASKAFVLSFGEALHAELAGRGVVLTVLSPGLMDTGFLGVAGQVPTASVKRMMMKPRPVVDIGLNALFKGRSSVIAGSMNNVMAFANRLTTRSLQARVAQRMMKT